MYTYYTHMYSMLCYNILCHSTTCYEYYKRGGTPPRYTKLTLSVDT